MLAVSDAAMCGDGSFRSGYLKFWLVPMRKRVMLVGLRWMSVLFAGSDAEMCHAGGFRCGYM